MVLGNIPNFSGKGRSLGQTLVCCIICAGVLGEYRC